MSVNLLARHVTKNPSVVYILGTYKNGTREYTKALNACTCTKRNLHFLTYKNHKKPHEEKTSSFLPTIGVKRWCSVESGPPSNKLPPLMNFPQIVWPSLIKSIRNFILSTFIIKPYFDREFNLPDFVQGAKKALEVVSMKMASGDVKSLEGLVTNEVMPNLQRSISLMSLPQREQLAINVDDIYFSFPYQVGVIFNDEEGKEQKRFVEITMVFHTLRGLAQMKSRGEEPPMNMGLLPEYQKRISICNYRFIREFTKGIESDWTVNLLNHFKPSDQMEE